MLHEYSVLLLASAGSSGFAQTSQAAGLLRAWAAWVGEGESMSQQEAKTQGVSPKCKHKEKASPWVKFIVQWRPVHLAADGCSILDSVIPLEKTSLVMMFSVPFSICT